MSENYDCVCRLCLSSRGELLPIFPTTSSDGSEPAVLATKIKDCVSVQISENDDLPTNVCRKCMDNVNNWHIFKTVCEKAQNKLESLKKGGSQLEEVKIKSEPLSDEAYDDGVVIDGSYPDYEQNASSSSKLQPEGPPILASLGLTPKSDKGIDSDKEDEEDEEDEETNQAAHLSKVPNMPEVSITVMRPSGETLHSRQGIQQLASKDCLVCGRTYRYSHNARRHELTAHSFDRYTNKITHKKSQNRKQPKLRPNPFNPKARLMPNPINHKMQLMPKSMPTKMVPHKVIPQPKAIPKQVTAKPTQNNLPYPLRIKALKDLQIKKKEPQILKTLLTSKPEVLVSEPEIVNSGPESPETLISEPEIASFQVETILSEPDAFDNQHGEEENTEVMDGEIHKNNTYDTVDMESDNEIEIARQQDQIQEDEDGIDDNDRANEAENYVDEKLSDNENNHLEREDDRSDNEKEIIPDIREDIEDNQDVDMPENGAEKIDDEEKAMIDESQGEERGENEDNLDDNEEDDDEGLPPIDIAPVVEINEDLLTNSFNSEAVDEEELDESADVTDAIDDEAKELDPDKQYVTKTQRDFIHKYRDIIEQINTKRCLCCDREHPRRKAVIQHLQKNGHKVPKHTCYNCVVTFGHIGALLSHMRANVCTDLWKIIYNDSGITDDMVIEDEPKDNKVQYKDIFNARSYACKLCPAKFQLKQFIMKHVLDVHEDGQSRVPLACVHCGARFKDKSLWKKHIRNGECTVYIACDLCTDKFLSMQHFNDHALAVHAGSFDHTTDNQSKNVDGRPTDCPICGKKNSNYPNLVKHLKIIHNEEKPHYCQHCDSKYEQAADLNKHIYMEHSDKTLTVQNSEPDMSLVKEEAEEYHYSCTECNAIFETVDAWTDHQVAEHNQVAHHCDQCEKKFLRPSELAEHKNTHLRVKFYPCSVCSNSYSTPQKLSEHVQQSHPGASAYASAETEFFCDICIRSFKSRQAYSNHMRIHAKVPTTNRRPGDNSKGFAPQIIGKPIKQFPMIPSSFLSFKPNCNVPNAPYSCDICGKGFMHKKNIWKHKKVLHADLLGDKHDSEENTMQASTEEDEYNNDENGTALTTPQFNSFNFSNFSNNLQQQQTMPYSCELCFKRFPLRTSLWKHKRAKHGIINVSAGSSETQMQSTPSEGSRSSCTICKITFSDKKSYYRHRKNVHKSNVQMCKICGKPLNSTLELYEHLKAAHARELLGYNANQGTNKIQETQSAELEMDYEGDQEVADPSAEYQARYPCDSCGKHFVGLLALQNHQCVNQSSSQSQTFDCEICHKSYTSIAALKSHRGWHLRSPDGKAAANNSGLWMPQHKVTTKVSKFEVLDPVQLARVSHVTSPATIAKRRLPPEVEVTVVNPNKKMRSDDSVEYERQQPTQAGVDDRYCSICDKEFTKRAAYQRHMDEVHQPNSVFCPVCDKSFTRKSTLLVHMRKHYGDEEGAGAAGSGSGSGCGSADGEMHACDLCGAQYQSDKALRAHRARHHGEDSAEEEEEEDAGAGAGSAPPGEFTCAQCGDGVSTPRELLAHRSMHATPSKFFCGVCKVYFARGAELAAHTRARHADADKTYFPCSMCDRFFVNKKSLQRHIEMAH